MHEKCFSVKAFPILSRCKESWKQEWRVPHLHTFTSIASIPGLGTRLLPLQIESSLLTLLFLMMVTEIRPFGNFLKTSGWLTGTSLCTNFATQYLVALFQAIFFNQVQTNGLGMSLGSGTHMQYIHNSNIWPPVSNETHIVSWYVNDMKLGNVSIVK